MKARILCTALLLSGSLLLYAGGKDTPRLSELRVATATGSIQDLKEIHAARAAVFILLAPECPISQQCTRELNTLAGKYAGKGILFYGVFPGHNYPAGEILSFGTKYKITFPLLMDTAYSVTSSLHGSITPQVFVTGNDNGILYSGAVDNSYRELGSKNARTTQHYLADALAAIDKNSPIPITRTKAVGCLVEGGKSMP